MKVLRDALKDALDSAQRTTESALALVHILEVELIREEELIFSESASLLVHILKVDLIREEELIFSDSSFVDFLAGGG